MARKTRDFTVGDPAKELLIFSWPMILAMVLQNLYNTADTLVVGRFVGDIAMGAVGTSGSVTTVVLLLMTGATTGMSIIISQYIGAKDERNVRSTLMTGIYIVLGCAAVFGALGFAFARQLLQIIKVSDPQTLEFGVIYLRIIFAGTIATAMYNMGNAVSRALGDSVTPMIVLAITCVLNVGLNVLFVAAFQMGVAGVGYATVLSTIISAVVCWVIIWQRFPIIRPDKASLRMNKRITVTLIRIGIPSALQSSTLSIGALLVQSMVNSFTTTALPVMAAYAAATKLEALISYPPGGITTGLQFFAGQNVGAGKFERVELGFRAALKIIIIYSVCSCIFLCLLGGPLMTFFTNTPVTVDIGRQYLIITGISVIFCGTVFLTRSTLVGAGDASSGVIISGIELGTRIVMAYVLSHFTPLGYIGVFLGSPIGWICGSAYGFIRYRSGKWKEKRLVGGEPEETLVSN